jgi:hypothetical protein
MLPSWIFSKGLALCRSLKEYLEQKEEKDEMACLQHWELQALERHVYY